MISWCNNVIFTIQGISLKSVSKAQVHTILNPSDLDTKSSEKQSSVKEEPSEKTIKISIIKK